MIYLLFWIPGLRAGFLPVSTCGVLLRFVCVSGWAVSSNQLHKRMQYLKTGLTMTHICNMWKISLLVTNDKPTDNHSQLCNISSEKHFNFFQNCFVFSVWPFRLCFTFRDLNYILCTAPNRQRLLTTPWWTFSNATKCCLPTPLVISQIFLFFLLVYWFSTICRL